MAQTIKFTFKLNVDGKEKLVETSTNAKELQKALSEARTPAENLRHTLMTYNQSVDAIRNVTTAVSQITNTLNDVTSGYRSFSGAMASANTMAGKTGTDFVNLKDKVADLAKEVPVARDELANGLYQVISNGVPEDNWISFLRDSAQASVGGIADLGETVKVTSTLIKNYGLDWSDAGKIQDKIQLTAKNGVTSFEQMAQALPRVSGNAATLGVSIDDLMASFATLTGVSGNTAEVSTQLAAIFTALVKPSSEAQQQARAMGIEFDAAAIKAAGGFRQFLTQLDKSVQEYAKKTGELPQTIYGKLFGSAESLRAINPLVGELSSKFEENAQMMEGSAGTIEEAFNTMADTGSAKTQLLKNNISSLTDSISGFVTPILPALNVISQLGMGAFSIMTLTQAFTKLGLSAKVAAFNTRAVATAQAALATPIGGIIASFGALAVGLGAVAAGYALMKDRMEDTDRKANELKDEIEELKGQTDDNNAAIRKYLPIAQDASKKTSDRKAAIDKLKSIMPDFFKNLDIESSKNYNVADAVAASNKAYRDRLVAIEQVAKAEYDQAKANYEKNRSDQGNAMMGGTNSGMNVMMEQQEKAEVEALGKAWNAATKALADYDKAVANPPKQNDRNNGGGGGNGTSPKYKDVSKLNYGQVKEEINNILPQLDGNANSALSKYYSKLVARRKAIEKANGIGSSSTSKKTAKAYESDISKIDKQLVQLEDRYAKASAGEKASIQKTIQSLQDKKKALEVAKLEAERPTSLRNEADADKELEYLNAVKEYADKDARPAIDALIDKVNLFKASLDRPAELDSVEAFDKEIQYQQALLKTASDAEKANINSEIERLTVLQDQFKNTYKPGSINFDNAEIQRKQKEFNSADSEQERARLNEEIRSLQQEVARMTANYDKGSISDLQSQLQEKQNDLNNRDLDISARLKLIDEIDDIQKQIDEKTNGSLTIPAEVTPTFIRKGSIEDKSQSYQNAQNKFNKIQENFNNGLIDKNEAKREVTDVNKELSKLGVGIKPFKLDNVGFGKTFDQIQNGWNSIKGVEGGIEGITNALSGNKNAWEVLTGVIDGVIQVFSGMQTIIGFVNLLTGATTMATGASDANAVSKIAEAGTISAAGGAAVEANTATTISSIPAIAANKTLAASWAEVAAAEYMAAHAYIPFAGFGIGAMYAGLAKGVILGMGNTAFASGGIVPGTSYSGDKVVAHVNSGEMILNAREQARLFQIATGALQPVVNYPSRAMIGGPVMNTSDFSGSGMMSSGKIVFKVKGRDMVAMLANDTRIGSKIGKRSNINIG